MADESLLQKILQRRLVPWTVAYLAGAFLVYQGIEILDQSLGLSPLIYHASHILLILGFLLTTVLAWHHGLSGPQRVTGKELLLLGAVLAAGGTAMVLLRNVGEEVALPPGFTITPAGVQGDVGTETGPSPRERREALGDLIAATFPEEGDQFEASLAILPLENQAGLPSLDTLASGMTDELITRLTRIRGLKVISRQSVEELQGLNLTPDEVADTLDVDHLLMGTARATGGGVTVEVRLVQIPQADTLWMSDYRLDEAS